MNISKIEQHADYLQSVADPRRFAMEQVFSPSMEDFLRGVGKGCSLAWTLNNPELGDEARRLFNERQRGLPTEFIPRYLFNIDDSMVTRLFGFYGTGARIEAMRRWTPRDAAAELRTVAFIARRQMIPGCG